MLILKTQMQVYLTLSLMKLAEHLKSIFINIKQNDLMLLK